MTPAQKKYWESMKGKRAEKTPAWKGQKASKNAFHKWLQVNYGKPTFCTNEKCKGKSKIYEWCKKTDKDYSHNPSDYLWLCRSCHRAYDLTPEKKKQAINNLILHNLYAKPNSYKNFLER